MSKHCEVCNRSYPDELAACPHCEEAVEILDEDVVELEEEGPDNPPPLADEPDSSVDLGLPTLPPGSHGASPTRPGEASGLSFIEWASLVEEPSAHGEAAAAKFDDPSDSDLKRHLPNQAAKAPVSSPPPMGTEATISLPAVNAGDEDALASDLEAVRTIFSGDPSASFARRDPEAKPIAPVPEDDDSALDLLSPGGREEAQGAEVVDSGIDLAAADLVSEGGSGEHVFEAHEIESVDSGIDLGAAELDQEVVDEALGEPSSGELPDSGIDLATLMTEHPSGAAPSSAAPPPDSGVDLAETLARPRAESPPLATGDSGVNLDDLQVVESPSGLAALAGDSGIDLGEVQIVDGSSSGISAIQDVDSGVDLVGPDLGDELSPAEPREEPFRPVSDSGLDLSGEDVLLGGSPSGPLSGIEKNTPGTSESGRDLIAEQVESGINLPLETFEVGSASSVHPGASKMDEVVLEESASRLAAGQLASEEEEVDLTETSPADVVDSSSIDLGASATFPAAPPEPASGLPDLESTRPFEPRRQGGSIHGGEVVAPSEVNLGGRHDEAAEDFFEESSALGGSGAPLDVAEEEASGLVMDEERPAAEEELLDEPEPVSEEEEDAAEEERPARGRKPAKEKRRSTAGAWLGGVVLGGLVGSCVCLALWLFNIEPPKEWRSFVPGGAAPSANANKGAGPTPAMAAPVTLADKLKWMKSGDLDPAQKAALEAADETKPEEVAARGESRVRDYLFQQAAGGKGLAADDEDLKKGLADLEKEKDANPDALFYLGVAKEAVKKYDEALKAYKDGAERFPAQKERFEAGVRRVTAKAGGMGRAEPARDDAIGLAALLVALEPADPAQPPPPAGDKPAFTEAGSAFWYAMTKADDGDYRAAVDALNQAADIHLKQRFSRLGKAQNPNSDPLEEVFPRSCKDLIAYLQLKEKLGASTLPVVKGKDPAKAVDDLLAEDKDLADKAAKTTAGADAFKKDLETSKKDLEDAKKETDSVKKDLDAAKKDLDAAKKDLDAAKDDVEAKKKDLAAAEKKAADLTADLKTVQEDAAKKAETLQGVAGALKPKFLAADADDAALLPAVKKAADLAAITDPKGEMVALTDSLNKVGEALKTSNFAPGVDKTALAPAVKKAIDDLARKTDLLDKVKDALKPGRLAPEADETALVPAVKKAVNDLGQRWEPTQMLTFWMPLLRERGRKDLADKAVADADRVLKDAAATPDARARAHAVKGMALRDLEQYDAAKAELEQANSQLSKEDAEWKLETELALADASDPSAFFTTRAEEFRTQGRTVQALTMLNRALETVGPQGKSRLLIERGALHLEQALAHGKGRAAAGDPDLVAAQKDAEEAKKDGAAEAYYLSGRINEELGQPEAAIQDYRQALGAHGALDAEGARYRAALARLLVLPRPAKVGMNGRAPALDVLAALIVVGLQPGDLPGQADPATKEALKLADEILSAKEGDAPFEARAQAYAIKGLWTQALTTYAEGLRAHLSPEDEAGLMAIINGHPALRRPTLLVVADPMEAEKHYAAGLRWYNDRQYDRAEKEFFTAVEQDGQDARYYYYLGLARLMQGDRDAYEDFEQGARLEQQNRPGRSAVSASLERIQGDPRQQLNDVRDRPR